MTDHIIARVDIQDSLIGETLETDAMQGQPFNPYFWTEGNGACDCNRFMWFINTKDPEVENDDYPCSDEVPRFRVKIFDDKGTLLFDDTQDAQNPFQIARA